MPISITRPTGKAIRDLHKRLQLEWMPRFKKDEEFRESLDSIGKKLQKYLDKERRSKEWFAVEMSISSTALRYKMRDNNKWTRWDIRILNRVMKTKIRI